MNHTHLFLYNLPSENHTNNKTTHFLKVVSEWDGHSFFNNKPYPITDVININKLDLLVVKNWTKALNEIEDLAANYFSLLDKLDSAKEIGTITINEQGKAIAV